MSSARLIRSLIASIAVVSFAIASGGVKVVSAYPPAPISGVLGATCSTASPGGSNCGVTFTVTNPDGSPAANMAVTFALSGCGSLSSTTGTTDAQGKASTTFIPPPAGSACCGVTTITSRAANGATAQTVINIACAVGLPAAGTLAAVPPAPSTPAVPSWAILLLAGSAAALLGSVTVFRLARRRS